MADLDTSRDGLSNREAAARRRHYGQNSVAEANERTGALLLLRQFTSPLVIILVAGALISLFLRDWLNSIIILTIVLGSTLLGFSQEYRSAKAVAALRHRLALTVRVMRDGWHALPAIHLVPGDIIELSAGNLIPADGIVLEAKDFLVSEASITGESFPVEKSPGAVSAESPISARTNSVFLGTSVRSGTAVVLVVETGCRTVFGATAARLGETAPETEFERGIRQFGYMLVRIMVALVLFVLVVNQLLGRDPIDSLLFAVALSVGISPELLPAIMSVTLSAGARAMARRGVLVRSLQAIENLGSIDVLCTDKTGTLTEGRVTLTGALDIDGRPCDDVRRLGFVNASLESGIENPLDAAITSAGAADGLIVPHRKVDEIPYDFMRKRLTIAATDPDDPASHLLVTKGAFDSVLAICTTMRRQGAEFTLTAQEGARLTELHRQWGNEGFRVLALAVKRMQAKNVYDRRDEADMCLLGFLLFEDPPKQDVAVTLRELADRGISLRVISGDNRHVTAHLAKVVGLRSDAMLTGAEIAQLDDEALMHKADRTDLFVEVDPQQKERLVRAMQRAGHAVGYLGDGINDAPALHTADVGISVDHAVDAARASAAIVLLRSDLAVLREGVDEGRRAVANTLKYISITTSANFGNMISMALVTPFLPFLPLSAKQILLNNFLSDLPSVAISTDNVDRQVLMRAQRWRMADVQRFMLTFGLISSCFDIVTFGILYFLVRADEATFQTAWFLVSLMTELAVVLVLRTHGSAFQSAPSRLLGGMTIGVLLIALALPFATSVAGLFGFVPLSFVVLTIVGAITVGYVAVTEIVKRWFFGSKAQSR